MSSGDTPNWANWMDAVNFRMGIISPLVSYMRAHPGDRKGLMKMAGRLAADACLHKRTVVRWLEAYGEGQVAGLAPRYHSCRSDHRLHVRFETLLDEAVAMRDASPTIGVMEIIRCLEGRHPGIEGVLKRSTMQRHLQKRGHGRKQMLQRAEASGGPFFSRYRLVHRFQQVQGDIKEPPRNCVVSERGLPAKPYIQLWMDNHSRRIVSFRVSLHERSDLALASLRALVQAYGVPESILTDQGSVYRGKKFAHCTHTLGIRHHRSRPYRPQAKGMNERANGTFDDLLLQVGQMRQVRFSAFCRLVKMRIDEYNRTPHSALTIRHEDGTTEAQTPDQCFFSDTYPIRLASPDIVGHAFRMFEGRKIFKDGTISLNGQFYKVRPGHGEPGDRVTIAYRTDNPGDVEICITSTDDEMRDGAPRYRFEPLFVSEIGPDTAGRPAGAGGKPGAQAADRDIAAEIAGRPLEIGPAPDPLPSPIPPTVERIAREVFKERGAYASEEQFQRDLPGFLFFTPGGGAAAEPSPYSKRWEASNGDK